jgi:2'-5' RNA ligase
VRTFFAVDVPAPAFGPGSGGRSAPTHLTLLFLGEVEETRIPALSAAAAQLAATSSPFEVRLAGVGAFPSAERPRVFWAGIDRGAAELTALHAGLLAAASELGLPVDARPFVPHLTLFRVRGRRDAERGAELLARHSATVFGSTRVEELLLKSSVLSDEGAMHTTLGSFRLGSARRSLGCPS